MSYMTLSGQNDSAIITFCFLLSLLTVNSSVHASGYGLPVRWWAPLRMTLFLVKETVHDGLVCLFNFCFT
jgi:hypothetical protein